MRLYYLLSVLIHSVLVMVVFVAGASDVQKPAETVTVVLHNEAFMAGGSGGDGKKPGSEVIKNTHKRIIREAAKTKHHKPLVTAKTEEARDKTVPKEAEKDNAIPSNESSELAMLGKPMQASADFDTDESGVGLGGGGTGIGGYGSGSGFGGKGTGGTGGTGKGYGIGHSEKYMRMKYLKEHFRYIRDMIMQHLTYPLLARKMGWKGQVTVSFVICEKGTVEQIRIIKSSGHKILDENVESTIREVQPFPKPPVRAEIIIPVVYRLG